MRFAERNAFAHHPLRQVSSQSKALRRQLTHAVGVELQRGDQTGHCWKQQVQLRHRVDDWFFVFLQVTVIRQRLCLERGQKPRQVTNQASGLTAGKLRDIRILLLRHDRGASRPSIA